MDQMGFGDAEYAAKKKGTRREVFLAEMEQAAPWPALLNAQRVTEAVKLDGRTALDGLNSRLEWQRVSAAELLLHIPYTTAITECAPHAAASVRGTG